RTGGLPGRARTNRIVREVLRVEREALERLVLEFRERKADDGPESVGRHPRVRDARDRQRPAEHLLVGRVDQREDPRVALTLWDAQERDESEVHLVDAIERLVAGGADCQGHAAGPAVVELVSIADAGACVPKLAWKAPARLRQPRAGVDVLIERLRGEREFVGGVLIERGEQGDSLLGHREVSLLILDFALGV